MRLTVNNLAHRFPGGNWLFQNLSLILEAGQVYALTGPSGSGKSTLLSILAGWEQPTVGTINRDGISKINWVFQNPYGMARRTAVDHVMLPLLAAGSGVQDARSRSIEIMERFNLGNVAESQFRHLSGGEAQRLMLARATAAQPELFLVDEPTAQLDSQTAAEVNAVLGKLATDGTIVVIATHDTATRDACSSHIDLREYTEHT